MPAPLEAVAIGAASIEDWHLNSPDHNPHTAMQQLLQHLESSGYKLIHAPADRVLVQPKQVWRDDDPRGYGRLLRIEEVTDTHAVVVQISSRTTGTQQIGRRSRILLRRFKPGSHGYSLVADVPAVDGQQ